MAGGKATGRKPSTDESYRHTVRAFVTFLKHYDAGRLTADDVTRLKDHRLVTPSPRTGRVPAAKYGSSEKPHRPESGFSLDIVLWLTL